MDSGAVIVGDYNPPCSSVGGSSRLGIRRETENLNNTVDLTALCRVFCPEATEYFSGMCESFSKMDSILNYGTDLDKFVRTEIISSVFSSQNGMKREINSKRNMGKFVNMWTWNCTLLASQ